MARSHPAVRYLETVDWATSTPSISSSPWIPTAVFPTHPINEITQTTIGLWAPYPFSGLPAPESLLKPHMPPKNGLRLNHLGDAEEDGRSRVVHTSSARSPRQAWQGT
jgi:hypothetical protein